MTGSAGTGSPGTAGTSAAAGTNGTAGTTATAGTNGTAGTTATAGTNGTAGTSATAGTTGTGGAGTAGQSGTNGRGGGGGGAGTGTGGSAVAGRGGSSGSAGTTGSGGSGGGSPAVPSAGCGKAGRPSGGKVTVTNDHIYDFPTSYDGNKPFPLLIGFHAASNPIDQIEGMTNNTEFATSYVRAFPKSAGTEWIYNTDLTPKVYKLYDDLMANYCIDTSRVFATGHSSGAQMIVQILTHSDATMHVNFKAVAPVAASNYGAIVKPIPVMYIQGKMDNVRNSDGADVVMRFRTANMCGSTSMPYTLVPACTSSGVQVNAGCIKYDGCSAPTIWCSHNDPQYSGTSHGVPCFAIKAMYDFFQGLP
jgi:polyhydroxybutyrate depolymerase